MDWRNSVVRMRNASIKDSSASKQNLLYIVLHTRSTTNRGIGSDTWLPPGESLYASPTPLPGCNEVADYTWWPIIGSLLYMQHRILSFILSERACSTRDTHSLSIINSVTHCRRITAFISTFQLLYKYISGLHFDDGSCHLFLLKDSVVDSQKAYQSIHTHLCIIWEIGYKI